ncbi:MAG: tetratricopeptide repeat protein [Candidatus Fermentibacteraceae bacterium]|nr:tetratricopeptide repeat protein [Candidatus Fermentibacteraceae bacterium]
MPLRKQAAVMFTDVVGFTSMMERSEEEAMQVLDTKMSVVRRVVASLGGRLIKEMGDGTLCVFPTTSDAVATAVRIQNALQKETFRIRIGIHCGSVLFGDSDVFGDTVNVASRLEQKAPGGGILLSGEVLSCIPEENRMATVNLGLTRLKGLGRLLQIHFLGSNSTAVQKLGDMIPEVQTGPLVISVFPLSNTGEPEDEFYAYGISADLLSDLARANSISVVPVTSLLKAMKGGNSTEDVARRFGSSFLVKGTIARVGEQMKLSLTVKTVDSDRTVWADTWLEEIDDLPLIKGKLADSILKALGRDPHQYPGITDVEVNSLSVYEKYLQAMHLWKKKENKQHILQTRKLIEEVIESEPVMIPARIMLGTTYRETGDYSTSLTIFREAREIAEAENNQSGLLDTFRAIGISRWLKGELTRAQTAYNKAMTLAEKLHNRMLQCSLLNNTGLIDCDRSLFPQALEKLEKSLSMAENLGSIDGQARSLCNIGLVYWRSGKASEALDYYKRSLRLVETINDVSGQANLLTNIGLIHNHRGEQEQAYEIASGSMKLSQDLDDKRAVCRALNNMGSVMLVLGMFTIAEKHFTDALSIARKIGLKQMEGLLTTNTAMLIMLKGDSATAENLFHASMKIAEDVDDKEGIIENSKYIAEILLEGKEASQAAEIIRSALELGFKYGLTAETAELETDLAVALVKNGSSVKEVLEQLEKAQKTKVKNTRNLPGIYWKWSEICSSLADNQSLSAGKAEQLRTRAAKWRSTSRDVVLEAAKKLKSEEYRNSFMHNIPLHHRILTSSV